MVKHCSLCCRKRTAKNLHALCTRCVSEDKQTCSECWSKLVELRGTHIDSPSLHICITCPWCRGVITERRIIEHPFSRSYHFFKAIYPKHVVAIQLLSMDRLDLSRIVDGFRHTPDHVEQPYLAWRTIRRGRPTDLEVSVQVRYHNEATAAAL